jgi:prefoldin subunit 5
MATAFEVVPENWKDASIKTIKLAQTIINKSDRGLEEAYATDPLPLIREACVSESNEKIHAYVRNTRSVVVKLRESFQNTNEEIKSLSRGKEALERALEHKRKDLALNVHSMKIRSTRPPREKEPDKADDLLKAERAHLLTLKKTLEAQLRKVQRQLQILGACRARLGSAIQERSRVLELICVPQSSTMAGVTFNRQGSSASGRKYHTRYIRAVFG